MDGWIYALKGSRIGHDEKVGGHIKLTLVGRVNKVEQVLAKSGVGSVACLSIVGVGLEIVMVPRCTSLVSFCSEVDWEATVSA